jgi:SAM-dependent methyltransferase
VRALLPTARIEGGRRALDLGAGRGITSYALAADGWEVIALEPDPGQIVGAGAIAALAAETGMPIRVVSSYAEDLPFADGAFDLVFARQVLHHALHLDRLCSEVRRVLKPGGGFVAVREPVITTTADLEAFRRKHPLYGFYDGENAHTLDAYCGALNQGGFRTVDTMGVYDTVINYFPMPYAQLCAGCREYLAPRFGSGLARILTRPCLLWGPWCVARVARRLSRLSNEPGRLYSFVAR